MTRGSFPDNVDTFTEKTFSDTVGTCCRLTPGDSGTLSTLRIKVICDTQPTVDGRSPRKRTFLRSVSRSSDITFYLLPFRSPPRLLTVGQGQLTWFYRGPPQPEPHPVLLTHPLHEYPYRHHCPVSFSKLLLHFFPSPILLNQNPSLEPKCRKTGTPERVRRR